MREKCRRVGPKPFPGQGICCTERATSKKEHKVRLCQKHTGNTNLKKGKGNVGEGGEEQKIEPDQHSLSTRVKSSSQ